MMIEILIVEDEKPISDLIRLNLMKAGYSCTCAFDGMEAADILEERNFDLIILDVMLPKLNGFELMEYIKPLGIPVIFLTAKATLDDRLRGFCCEKYHRYANRLYVFHKFKAV
jgi:DNA-binding response OmpR family regulator